jgi:hypothetical protein
MYVMTAFNNVMLMLPLSVLCWLYHSTWRHVHTTDQTRLAAAEQVRCRSAAELSSMLYRPCWHWSGLLDLCQGQFAYEVLRFGAVFSLKLDVFAWRPLHTVQIAGAGWPQAETWRWFASDLCTLSWLHLKTGRPQVLSCVELDCLVTGRQGWHPYSQVP